MGLGLSAPPRPGISDNQPMEEQDRFLFQRLCEADFSGRGSGGDWRRQAKDELAAMAEIPVKARRKAGDAPGQGSRLGLSLWAGIHG